MSRCVEARDVSATDKLVIPINNGGHSFFSDMSVTINHTRVEGGDNNYAWLAYLNNALQYSHASKTTHMQSQGFYGPTEDSAGKAWTDKDHATNAAIWSASVAASATGLYYDIPLKVDLLQQEKNFPPGFQLMFELVRSDPQFALFCPEKTFIEQKHQVVFSNMKLDIPYVKPTEKVQRGITQAITNGSSILYQFNSLCDVRWTIPKGLVSKHISNVFNNNQPKLAFFVLTVHATPDQKVRPFIFKQHKLIDKLALRSEGRLIGGSELDGQVTMQTYARMMQALNLYNANEENGIDFESFKKYFYFLAFDCTTNRHIASMQNPSTVQYDLDIQFKASLAETCELHAFFIKDKRLIMKMRERLVISDDYIAPRTANPVTFLQRRSV